MTGTPADRPVAPGEPHPVFTELSARRLGPVRRYFLRHPVAMDLVVVAWFGVPALVGALLPPTSPVAIVLGVVCAVALFWRRRAPLWTAAATGALAVVSLVVTGSTNGIDFAIALVVYAVAASRRPRTAWLTLAAVVLPVAVAVLVWEQPIPEGGLSPRVAVGDGTAVADMRAASVTTLVMLALVALAIGSSVRNRRLHVAALVDRANALAVEREQGAQLAAAAERARIAREMHDVVAHSLSVMIALADGASAALERSPARAREALDELSGTGRSALSDMRRVLGALRDPGSATDPGAPLDPQPGSTDLGRLVEVFRTAGVPVRWTSTGPPLPPDAGLQLAVYRIVQEALTNVLRHAPGTARADVVLASAPGRVEVTVTDGGPAAGAGSAPVDRAAVGSGKGLIGMQERAAVYGGQVVAGAHDGGWRVRAVLTWDGGAP